MKCHGCGQAMTRHARLLLPIWRCTNPFCTKYDRWMVDEQEKLAARVITENAGSLTAPPPASETRAK